MTRTPSAPAVALDHARKEAKRLLRGLRAGDPAARALLPGPGPDSGLREVQHALARARGFATWAEFKEHAVTQALAARAAAAGDDALLAEFLRHACLSYDRDDWPQKWRRAESLRARHPELGRASVHAACVAGEIDVVRAALAHDPEAARRPGGPQNWEPLLFVCFGRLPHPPAAEHALALARLLLDHGADPNAHFWWGNHDCRFSALAGAVGKGELGQPSHPHAEALARLLLERGANPNDEQALYDDMLIDDDDRWLRLLLSYGLRDQEQLDFLLGHAASMNHLRRAACLLEHGAVSDVPDPYNGKTAYENALLGGHLAMADLLLRHGAVARPLAGYDAFVAACMRLDEGAARALAATNADYVANVDPLIDAAEHGRRDVVALLLALGLDPNTVGKHDKRPLHVATGHPEVALLLLDHGADPSAEVYGGTATEWALTCGQHALACTLAARSRSVHDAARAGDAELLGALLAESPARATAVNGDGNTPLHTLPDDVDCARPIIALLVAHGADARATNAAGKTPAEVAEARGLDDLADLLESEAFAS